MGNLIVEKSRAFALKSIKVYERLKASRETILSKQFLRSATSIGANIAEGQYAQSKADFLSKYSTALKEASETRYWMDLLRDSGYVSDSKTFGDVELMCDELIKLLVSSVKKGKKTR